MSARVLYGFLAALVLAFVAGCPRVTPPTEPQPPAECGGEELTVKFYDAGQALSALVTLPDGRRILIDTGESPTRPGCGAAICGAWNQRVVSGVAQDLAGDPIDLVWITHQHSDHHGGLPSLGVPILNYVDNGTQLTKAGVVNARAAATSAGAALHVVSPSQTTIPIPDAADVQLKAIVASQWPVSNCANAPNECSIGLEITYCDSSILFTGDGEEHAEGAWPVSDINLLQVGHHGSNTSSTQPFINSVSPEYAVISSGKRDEGTNRTYCHPIKSTIDRLTTATGGAGSRSVETYDASIRKCSKQTAADWKNVAISDHLWLTAFDGDVTLTTTGDGTFTRVPNAALIDINTATKAELETLPGIGPVKARAIIDYRNANGPFATTGDLVNVPGIGPATLASLSGLITASSSAALVNINTASAAELDALPGIGPVKAADIVSYRNANGPFATTADLVNVPGIGPATMAGLAGLITV